MPTRRGQRTRAEVPDWDTIDWFRSTAELSRQVTAALATRYPRTSAHVGHRRLGRDAMAFVADRGPSGVADATPAGTEIKQLASAIFDTHW